MKIIIIPIIFIFKILFFANQLFASVNLENNQFIIEKKCPIYELVEDGSMKKRINDNPKIDDKFEIKDIKKIKKEEYLLLKNHAKQFFALDNFYIKKNCGYIEIDNSNKHVKFNKDFLNEFEILEIQKNSKKIDKEVLEVCGAFGSKPKKENLLKVFFNNKDELRQIYNEFAKKDQNYDDFSKEAVEMLFKNNGFTHVFCGILKETRISGPHYAPRFLDLQKKNLIGSMNDDKDDLKKTKKINKEISFVTRPLAFLNQKNIINIKSSNTFSLEANFTDLLKISLQVSNLDYSESYKFDEKKQFKKNNQSDKFDLDPKNKATNLSFKNKDKSDNIQQIEQIKDNKKEEYSISENTLTSKRKLKNFLKNEIKSCIYEAQQSKNSEDGKVFYKIVFHTKNQSLITIYPISSSQNVSENLCKFNK